MKTAIAILIMGIVACLGAHPQDMEARKSKIGDLVTIEGVRENSLIGYGMVVGLNGTGDRSQTVFTTQTLANILQRMGVQVPSTAMRVNNVAAVFVTATLPPFARPGMRLDVTVSSMGDAKSLEGGVLLLTPLRAADDQVHASAQGPITLGGYSAGPQGNSKQVNHPTVGRIPDGGIIERETSLELGKSFHLALLMRDPSFSGAREIADSINHEFGRTVAHVGDSRRIEVSADVGLELPLVIARIEQVPVKVARRAKVVVNERTGTVVIGGNVRLGAVSILHGSLSIEISTEIQVSQPQALSSGETVAAPRTTVRARDDEARRVQLNEGASVEQLVTGFQSIGATSREVVAILQAIKAAGALDAELEVI